MIGIGAPMLTVVFHDLKLSDAGLVQPPIFRLVFARDLAHRPCNGARKKKAALKRASKWTFCIRAEEL